MGYWVVPGFTTKYLHKRLFQFFKKDVHEDQKKKKKSSFITSVNVSDWLLKHCISVSFLVY